MGQAIRLIVGAVVWASALLGMAQAAEFEVRLAHVSQTDNPIHDGIEFFAKKVAEKTNGRMEIKIFPAGQLGGERDYIEGLQLGSLEMTVVTLQPLVGFEKSVGLFTLPFLFRSAEHLDHVTDGPIGKAMSAKLATKGLHVLGFPDFGGRLLYNSKRLVRTPEDMKGLKFRATENPIHIATYQALGARAIPMARPEVYSALKQGVIDGLDAGISFYESMGDYEIARHLTLGVELFQSPGVILVSEAYFQKLPPDIQAALQAAADEAVPYERKVFRGADAGVLARVKAKGVDAQVADPKPFAEAVKPIWKQFENDVGGRALIDQVVATP